MRRGFAALLGVKPDAIPQVFLGAKPKPLVIGVHVDLLSRYPGVDPAKLSRWLKRWTLSHWYCLAMVEAKARHDLKGRPVALVDEGHRAAAVARLGAKKPAPPPAAPTLKHVGKKDRPTPHLSFKPSAIYPAHAAPADIKARGNNVNRRTSNEQVSENPRSTNLPMGGPR